MAKKAGNRPWFDALRAQANELAQKAPEAIEHGNAIQLGALFDSNHGLLREIGVSTPMLDRLVDTARQAGAYGAKLTGAGMGGCVVAVVPQDLLSTVISALEDAGSPWVKHCRLEGR